MKPDTMLMIPGPTPIPDAIREVLARPVIGHRSDDFKKVMKTVTPGLQWLFRTSQPVFTYAASGTGAMEAALMNVLNPGDHILVLACGVFSQRWAEIANTLGLQVHIQEVSAGHYNSPNDLRLFLNSPLGKEIKAVCLIHSETSTGVLNPVEELAQVVRQSSSALIIVDTVTGLGAAPFQFDNWGIDIAVSGSQKGFMLPPGLAFLAVSERAMEVHKTIATPGYYFNFSRNEKGLASGQTPYTPAVTLIRGLEKALELLQEEDYHGIYFRHELNQQMVRRAMTAMGLALFVKDEAYASTAVTSVLPDDSFTVDNLRAGLRKNFSITIANGQKDLAGKIFRIGHLGAVFPRDMLTVISAIEFTCHQLGYKKTPMGTAVQAAMEVLSQNVKA